MSEKLDIILYYRDEAKCRAIAIEGYGNVHPSYTIVYVNYFTTIDRIVAEVIKAKITYGDANDSILEALQNLQRDINEVDNALDTELANSYAYEEAKRREAIVALQNWIYVQQYLLNAQRTAAVQQGAGHYHVQQEMQCTYMGGNRIRCDPY